MLINVDYIIDDWDGHEDGWDLTINNLVKGHRDLIKISLGVGRKRPRGFHRDGG